jgi:hypothetical protein
MSLKIYKLIELPLKKLYVINWGEGYSEVRAWAKIKVQIRIGGGLELGFKLGLGLQLRLG